MMASTCSARDACGAFPCRMFIKAFSAETFGSKDFDRLRSYRFVLAAQTAVIFITKCAFARDCLGHERAGGWFNL